MGKFKNSFKKEFDSEPAYKEKESCIRFAVYGWIQILGCGWRLTRIFIAFNYWEKWIGLPFSQKNIYSHTAVVAPILRLRLTVQIQKLKYKLKSLKHKSLEYSYTLSYKVFLLFSDKLAYSQLINWLTYRFSTAQTSLITNTLKKWWCTKAYWKHWRLTFIYDSFFAINISRLSLFWFHKQPWSMFWKIIVFLQFSKIVGDN